uniref:Uncharacterized protein n=1 Tax=Lactuca sativa TaxID=4236 RepID=A0A9R1UH84_LACSA|nr:hypothetical protein LSAT_V11C900464940 [Lactuca sativa]
MVNALARLFTISSTFAGCSTGKIETTTVCSSDSALANDSSSKLVRLLMMTFFIVNEIEEDSGGMGKQRYDAFNTAPYCVLGVMARGVTVLMALGESPDSIDDYMEMLERTARESLYKLTRGVIETFGDKYLRKPSLNDIQQLYAVHEERHGFPRMLGSIDCTKWIWRNCPMAWKGKTPYVPFTINGHEYKFGYYFTDGIYLAYSTFVKAFRHPIEPRDKFFKRRQVGARKDVEHAFGVLKAK